MDMISIRRKLMATQNQPAPTGYVTDGLVLWLDGIEKGQTANAWVDKISGYVFQAESNVSFGDNYIELFGTATSNLKNSDFRAPSVNTGTIEVAISDYSTASPSLIFMPINNGIAFGLYNKTVLWSATTVYYKHCVVIPNDAKTISVCNDRAVANLQDASFNNDGRAWSGVGGNNYIGRRGSGSYFTGKIHAIRMYDRMLTRSEMIQNQRLDNQRFNLGL